MKRGELTFGEREIKIWWRESTWGKFFQEEAISKFLASGGYSPILAVEKALLTVQWPALISITGYSFLVGSRKNKNLFIKELNKLETNFVKGQRKLNSLENKMQSHVPNQSRKVRF